MGVDEDAIIDDLKDTVSCICLLAKTRERSLAITKLQECIMWLEKGRE
jgi:hypothetical protein